MRGLLYPFTAAEVVQGARQAVRYGHGVASLQFSGRAVAYALGEGGKDPAAQRCDGERRPGGFDYSGKSDCVGFVMHAAAADRYQPTRFPLYGGWINCNSMILDARSARPSMFREIPRGEVRPGDFVVYPSRLFGLGHGHVGIVLEVLPRDADDRTWTDNLVVAHCSAGHQRLLGYAISQEVGGKIWTRRATVVRPLWYKEAARFPSAR